jgi:hypothetical protein
MSVAMCVAVVLLTAATSALAQATNTMEITHPAGLMTLSVAEPVVFNSSTSTTAAWTVRPAGRFSIRTSSAVAAGGNPLVAGDEGRTIASELVAGSWNQVDYTSKVTFSVDSEQRLGTSTRYLFDLTDLMYNQSTQTSQANLPVWWPQPPAAGTRDITGTAYLPIDGTTTSFPGGADLPDPKLRVRHSFTLVHDAVMIEYVIYNDDTVAHQVGLRQMIDGTFGGSTNLDGGPIILDNGTVINTETVMPDPANPSIIMPTAWTAYDDVNNPVITVRGTVLGDEVNDPGIASVSAGPPDQIEFGIYGNMGMTNQFVFTPNSRQSLAGEDWAYAVKWEERVLLPGQSRRYVTYYGLGAAAADYNPPYVLAAYTPVKLTVQTGDDPATPTVEQYYLTDAAGNSPFTVTAMLDNFGAAPLINASVRISLPQGLELWPDTQPRTMTMGLVERNRAPLVSASWTVRAAAVRPGDAEIKFTGPNGKTVRRSISIPAIPMITARQSQTGLEMLSVPYAFTNSDASNVFGSLSDPLFPGGAVALWRYDPGTNTYKAYPDTWTSNVTPGKAYWLLNQNRETVVLPATATPVPTNQSYMLNLKSGWNQIGNPFVVPVRFDRVRVIGPQGVEWSLNEAIERGLLLPVLYAYDAANNEYTWATSISQTSLTPYEGYWVLAYANITLLFPPPALYGTSAVQGQVVTSQATEGWQVELAVNCAGQQRAGRSFGVAPAAAEGRDLGDVPSPPGAIRNGPALDAYFTMPAADGQRYLVDIKPEAAARSAWDFSVMTEAVGAPVTISWPSLSSAIPDDLVATLEDVDTGRRTYMRTSTSYTYNSNTGGTRNLRIVVRPRAGAALGLTAACAGSGGGGLAISYSLSSPANVDVEVRNIAGRVIKRIVSESASDVGTSTVLWNGLSTRGTAVPSGIYVIQVTARSQESGESASVIRTAHISR